MTRASKKVRRRKANPQARFCVGVVGAGIIAREHARSLVLNRRVSGLLFHDVDSSRAVELARDFDGQQMDSVAELCAESDLVWICVPQFAHRPLVEAACRAGKAVFCEKPLAHSAADLRRIRAAVAAAGVPFFMGQSGRYNGTYAKMKALVDAGAVGKPTKLFSLRQGYIPLSGRPAWTFDDKLSGGAIVELGVHEIDFLRWVGGDFLSVSAVASPATLVPGKCQDSLVGIGEMQGGAAAWVDVSWANPRYVWQRGIVGTEGSIFVDDSSFMDIIHDRPGKKPKIVKGNFWRYEPTGENEAFRNQVTAVINALAAGTPPPCTLEDGARAVETALAMRKAAATGRRVKVG